MTTFLTLVAIIQSFSISLGVGSSTLAIVSFFVAIADGTIDATERKMMGVVYIVLRVAMILILISTLLLISTQYPENGILSLSTFAVAQLFVILILFFNAMLMTAHLIPSSFGPAIQAGNWYTLGTLSALALLGLTGFSLSQFFLAYVTWIILAVALVNGVIAILRAKRHGHITS